jgi:type III secretion system (T3SS) inner membrane Yop/YscD-like protein
MSLRLFIYYCAVCGCAAALLGWGAGRLLAPADDAAFFKTVVYAIFLGLTIAAGLGLVDGLWSYAGRWNQQVMLKLGVGVLVGAAAGAAGGIVGQFLYSVADVLRIVGWVLTGLLIGASVGVYDIVVRLVRKENLRSALRKIMNGTIGGAIGGFVGGILHLILAAALQTILEGRENQLSPSAVAFAALGTSVGLLIGLALVIFKQAWIKVESGFRPGRELILSKPEIKIGKGEECEVGLYGGAGVEKLHARINQRGLDYFLSDALTDGGTFLNEKRIKAPAMLRSGDRIRVGNCVLLFQERRKGQRK